jgi:AmmeMemoRadiSam system protein B
MEETSLVRQARYTGSWYPADRAEIREYLDPDARQRKVIAALCPHAGWIYSGKTSGEVFSRIEPKGLYILVGPNHHGVGSPISVYPEGAWETPLGRLNIDEDMASAILRHMDTAEPDPLTHQEEHSLEVQMPFVKFTSPDAAIVPISLTDYRASTCRLLGSAIAEAVKELQRENDTVLIASSDMSHYVPADYARQVDSLAINEILRLDPDGLLQIVQEKDITMCGSGPAAAVIHAAKALGASKAELVRYTTSADVTGEDEQVVAYAGMIIY